MSNLRWIVRDGKEVLQELRQRTNYVPGSVAETILTWEDVPTHSEPPKKSLAQVLYEQDYVASGWADEKNGFKALYENKARDVMDYLEKEGWRKG